MADELREDKQSINHKVLIPFQTDRFIESDKQLSFNVGYLFLQRIFYQLGLPSICRKIKKDNSFDYDLSDMKFFDDYLISFRRKEKEMGNIMESENHAICC